jgi:DNA-binding NtrC family response regulator
MNQHKQQIQQIKQRFGIVGFDAMLDRAINIAIQVAPTDLSVLITGESGVGKEVFSKIIHENSQHKRGKFIAVNCGAIPDGTIDSELFGHEKGAFTGAIDARKGYFEVADGGTIFLDEVADLPLATQVRLLRVLENGEFIKVGSSTVQKTKVRVVAATNVNVREKIARGQFREDLFYRLNTVPIHIPALRERKEDIFPLFQNFAIDFAEKNNLPPIQLTADARELLTNFAWPGNIRQLRNITEQISIIEVDREINAEILSHYLDTHRTAGLPVLFSKDAPNNDTSAFERELVFKFLGDLKKEVANLKDMVMQMRNEPAKKIEIPSRIDLSENPYEEPIRYELEVEPDSHQIEIEDTIVCENPLSLIDVEKELIQKALLKHNNKRKLAAEELGISERTLYRKIKEYNIQ